MNLLGLALIHEFVRETLSGERFVEARGLLVEWLELLLLGDLCPKELVIEESERVSEFEPLVRLTCD